MGTALMLILLGLFCIVGAIVGAIFTIISFANQKQSKFTWLTVFLVCLTGLIICIFTFVRKVVNKVENLTTEFSQQFEHSMKNYSDSLSFSYSDSLPNNEQIQLLRSYYADSTTAPDQFYYYLGFENYFRLPLRYPYSIHCNVFKDNGELYNESNVRRFDENDNGEIFTSVDKIDRIAFDKNYLLIDQKIASTRSADYVHHYKLFSFETEKTEEANSEKELLQLARSKGYNGTNKLISLEEYSQLFK